MESLISNTLGDNKHLIVNKKEMKWYKKTNQRHKKSVYRRDTTRKREKEQEEEDILVSILT